MISPWDLPPSDSSIWSAHQITIPLLKKNTKTHCLFIQRSEWRCNYRVGQLTGAEKSSSSESVETLHCLRLKSPTPFHDNAIPSGMPFPVRYHSSTVLTLQYLNKLYIHDYTFGCRLFSNLQEHMHHEWDRWQGLPGPILEILQVGRLVLAWNSLRIQTVAFSPSESPRLALSTAPPILMSQLYKSKQFSVKKRPERSIRNPPTFLFGVFVLVTTSLHQIQVLLGSLRQTPRDLCRSPRFW